MTEDEKLRRQRFRAELEARTVKFAADVHRLIQNVHGDEFKNFRFQIGKSSTSIGANLSARQRGTLGLTNLEVCAKHSAVSPDSPDSPD